MLIADKNNNSQGSNKGMDLKKNTVLMRYRLFIQTPRLIYNRFCYKLPHFQFLLINTLLLKVEYQYLLINMQALII